jgi:hypothetical protein
VREYTVYSRAAAKDARRRVHLSVQKRLSGPTPIDSLRIEQLADTATQFAFRLQRTVEHPIYHFRNIAGKISYALSMVLRLAYMMVILGGLGFVANFVAERWFGRKLSWSAILEAAASVGWFGIVILLVAVVIIRSILARVSAPDQKPSSER